VVIKNDPGCADLYNKTMGLIEDFNIYDLFRTQYGNSAGVKMTEAERERTVMVEGQEKKYKLGYTMAERTPFRRLLTDDDKKMVFGNPMSDYLNRPDVRMAFNIPASVPGWNSCNDPMYVTY
jgi:hypothetical protein